MLIDSFEHAEADFEARQLIEARNEAANVIQATEKSLALPDFEQIAAEALKSGERRRIEAALVDLKASVGGRDREAIQQATGALNEATRHLAEIVMNRSVREALAGKSVSDV